MGTLISLKDSEHTFKQINYITQSSEGASADTYGCIHCDLIGRRVGLSDFIEVTVNTTCKVTKSYKPHLVKLNINKNLTVTFGLINDSIVLTVPCPIDQRLKYEDTIWVSSPALEGESVRLHHNEYEIVEKPVEWFEERIGKTVSSENVESGHISEYQIADTDAAIMLYNYQFQNSGYLFS